jgi:tetratricopeptide (TPR) repeat protein
MLPLVLLVAQLSGAWSSTRPPECAALDTGKASNVWERAKAPELQRYCDLLASGAAKLASSTAMAKSVATIADDADKLVGGKAAPLVLKGRALGQLNDYAGAYAALVEAKKRDERALDDPQALFVWARSLSRTGHPIEALDAYRTLLPRASVLTLKLRSAAAIDAGMIAMSLGPKGLDEAIPIVRQATRDGEDAPRTMAALALALALDRAGDHDAARGVLDEQSHGDPKAVLTAAAMTEWLGPAGVGEGLALEALAVASWDPDTARADWKAYLEKSPKGVWAEHARAALAAVGAKKKRKAP